MTKFELGKELNVDSDAFNICAACIGDEYLKTQIAAHGASGNCDQCGLEGPRVDVQWLADQVEESLSNHYYYTSEYPDGVPLDLLKEGNWERSGDPLVLVIAEMLGTDEEPIAKRVHQALEDRNGDLGYAKCGEEDPWSEEAHYARKHPDGAEYEEAWTELDGTLRTESRYFNRRAEEVLALIFDGVENLTSVLGITETKTGGPKQTFNSIFRGRVAKTEEEVKILLANPERQLGAPPKGTAAAGRMNAAGISVFYAADSHDTVVAEVRPPVGSRVVVARFKFIRELKFLRITGFKEIRPNGSDFDPAHLRRLKQTAFLRYLSRILTRPVLPGDETSEYLVTQAVAEFLSKRFDGLIFSSVQAGKGFNVVLFDKAANVHVPPLPGDIAVSVECERMTSDGLEPDYMVIERTTTSVSDEPEPNMSIMPESLLLERNTLTVHHVEAVTYKTADFIAARYRFSPSSTEEF